MNHNNNIPLDIISEILLRLPIKSIGRFKCVSKSWRCLISESRFVKMHLHRSISNNSDDDDDNTRIIVCDSTKIMLTDPSRVEPPMDLNGLPPIVGYGLVVGSCHGLFLQLVYDEDESIFLWNPCTREHRELPKHSHLDNPFFAGIGYDSHSDDYKVVICASVFSLKNNSWKTLTNIPCDYQCSGNFDMFGVFFDGSLYWMARQHNTKRVILTFDLDTEQYLESPQLHLPPEPDGLSYDHLFVMGTCLSIFLCGRSQWEHEVWVMKKQGAESVWTKSFVVAYGYGENYVRAICLLKSGELLLLENELSLVLYNPMDGTTTRNISPGDFTRTFYGYGYIESLVSPYRVHETRLGEE